MLLTVIERLRGFLDDPMVNAKYDNSFLAAHIIAPAMADVYSRMNMTSDNPVLIRHSITLNTGQEYYQLPAMIGSVWRLAFLGDHGEIIREYLPRGVFHPSGPGWALEENLLVVRPYPTGTETIDIWYSPSGQYMPHYGDGMLDADGYTLTLDATPTLGLLDRRDGAYNGSILRLLPEDGMIEERVIDEHLVCAGTLRVRRPFVLCGDIHTHESSSSSSSNENLHIAVTYEVAPQGSQGMYEAIACRAALKLSTYRNASQKHRNFILDEYKSAIKTLRDHLTNMQLRTGKYHQKDTVDNESNWIMVV